MMQRTLFRPAEIPGDVRSELKEFCRLARGDVIRMTTLAGSGHPGGSMSSMEVLAMLYSQADVDPRSPVREGRDRIVVSNGHISPGVYSVLGRLGFFDLERAVATFRKAGSPFEGHIERSVPGVELTTGNLGQGLSAAAGMAVADRARGIKNRVWVLMGDGEQQKGQIGEARRFVRACGLDNVTVVVDCNGLQISGRTNRVMYTDIAAEYRADGWEVVEVDGHSISSLYRALRPQESSMAPRLVLAMTVMGKGVSFMENDPGFHGSALDGEQAREALGELGQPDDLELYRELRERKWEDGTDFSLRLSYSILDLEGAPILYPADHVGDNRSAFGEALLDLARTNQDDLPLVFDCDLAGSVRTKAFADEFPDHFFQCGVMEHNTASASGGASIAGKVVFWADFGVFAADETFNQHRLNDINMTNLKVVATHCGLDVGMDGKTHQCIKYVNLMGSLHHYNVIVPADPNQTDRVIRFVATHPGNFFVAMGRSKQPVIAAEGGEPYFGPGYRFVYGMFDRLRSGSDVALVAMGNMVYRALEVRELLAERGVDAAVYNLSCPLCMSPRLMRELAGYRLVTTCEDHDADTGMGARVALALAPMAESPPLMRVGVTEYGVSGAPEDLYRMQGMLPEQIAGRIVSELG